MMLPSLEIGDFVGRYEFWPEASFQIVAWFSWAIWKGGRCVDSFHEEALMCASPKAHDSPQSAGINPARIRTISALRAKASHPNYKKIGLKPSSTKGDSCNVINVCGTRDVTGKRGSTNMQTHSNVHINNASRVSWANTQLWLGTKGNV